MFTEDVQMDIMRESRGALSKIHENQGKKVTLLEEAERISKQKDMGKGFYKPYDQIAFESKIRVDMMYYDQLFQKLDENVHPQIEGIMSSLFTNVRKIYEFVNIAPEFYGKGINESIIDDSLERAQRRLSKAIYENLDRNFYKLNEVQRKERYYDKSKEVISTLITDGSDADDAIKFGIKTVVIENLLKNISFPFSTWSRIQYLTDNIDYGKVFDQDKLVDLVESFEKKIHNLAKIISTCV